MALRSIGAAPGSVWRSVPQRQGQDASDSFATDAERTDAESMPTGSSSAVLGEPIFTVLEALMLVSLGMSLIFTAAYILQDVRLAKKALQGVDPILVLTAADGGREDGEPGAAHRHEAQQHPAAPHAAARSRGPNRRRPPRIDRPPHRGRRLQLRCAVDARRHRRLRPAGGRATAEQRRRQQQQPEQAARRTAARDADATTSGGEGPYGAGRRRVRARASGR